MDLACARPVSPEMMLPVLSFPQLLVPPRSAVVVARQNWTRLQKHSDLFLEKRSPWMVEDVEVLDVQSADIRARLSSGRSIAELSFHCVEEHLRDNCCNGVGNSESDETEEEEEESEDGSHNDVNDLNHGHDVRE
eukprot:TRINITY_DN18925_c0_g1_i1.p1 TRINITY_DN18925_c0_g1~~TRINITY_DN18925_c0_g1_i1.p1  ORF type:complete len:135 (+),score=27.49 TRINITY_DN18925_c0_g1_i1:27-431(+)